MSLSRFASRALACLAMLAGIPGTLLAQGTYTTNGSEYAIAGTLPSDQTYPCLALATTGGFLAWQDNITDGDGLGISALRLDSSFSASLASFRVNATAAGDQENPQASLLSNGGATFVWQGGQLGFQHIYARFLSASNIWLTAGDVLVNSATNCYQVNPAIATLSNGNVIVVYSSLNQAGSNTFQDVYGQILSPAGQKIGGEFLINQFTAFNQRTPAVAALANGGFVVVWVTEQQNSAAVETATPVPVASVTLPSVDIYARLYAADGTPTAGEFRVNTGTNVCANPRVAAAPSGGFLVVWGERNTLIPQYSWDIYARPFSSAAVGGTVLTVNTYLYGDQYSPQISALGNDFMVVWTSLAQDGSREGVFGQILHADGSAVGGEFRVNTTTISQQMQPAVASDGYGRFLVTWTSFVGGVGSFDLYAQRYVNVSQPLLPMNAPFVFVPFTVVSNIYQPQILVSWPVQTGLPIDHYEVYVDGALTPTASVTTNVWLLTGLAPNSNHSFRVAYVTPDQRRSPLSPAASATTWIGYSWYGVIPFEWMSTWFGYDTSKWPLPNAPVAPGGPTLLQVFLTGANPTVASTWLSTALVNSPQGYFLTWNPQPGRVYQVQTSADLSSWSNLGAPRFAAGAVDSLYVGISSVAYYRVLLMR
jgi:hypothetical protein